MPLVHPLVTRLKVPPPPPVQTSDRARASSPAPFPPISAPSGWVRHCLCGFPSPLGFWVSRRLFSQLHLNSQSGAKLYFVTQGSNWINESCLLHGTRRQPPGQGCANFIPTATLGDPYYHRPHFAASKRAPRGVATGLGFESRSRGSEHHAAILAENSRWLHTAHRVQCKPLRGLLLTLPLCQGCPFPHCRSQAMLSL